MILKTVKAASGAVFLICAIGRLNAEVVSYQPPAQPGLTLSNLIQLVVQRNEALQAKAIDFEASRHKHLAEKAAFEPDLVGSVSREVNTRPNNAVQQNEDQNTVLRETNNVYDTGLESLIPTGAKMHLGYTLTDIHNNVFPTGFLSSSLNANLSQLQYQSFFGLTVDQPLLKNFGPAATMASMRVAALSSKIAFQEYRLQLIEVVYDAEKTYWALYANQEVERTLEQSVANAERILGDNRTKFDAGKSSEIDVVEAQSALALRRAQLGETRRKVVELANYLVSLYAGRSGGTNGLLRAVDAPPLPNELQDFQVLERNAFTMNPKYIIQQEKVDQELIRLGYARNQRLPEVDLKGAYGLNGLGSTPGFSFEDIQRERFTSWSVGVEFRVPLGMTKARHEYSAAEMQLQSAEMSLQELQTEILNGFDTARHQLTSLHDAMVDYQTAADSYKKVYEDARVTQQAGKLETIKVFEREFDWLRAEGDALKAVVDYQIALADLQRVSGLLLQQYNLDLTQDDLQRSTREMLNNGHLQPADFMHGNNEQTFYHPGGPVPDDSALLNALHQREQQQDNQPKGWGQ